MASAVLSLLSSSSMELSDEKDSVKFLDCTICNNSPYHRCNTNLRLQNNKLYFHTEQAGKKNYTNDKL